MRNGEKKMTGTRRSDLSESGNYKMAIKGGRLVFRTTSFKVEGGSFLHGGIFNRELASSLASGAMTLLSFIALYFAGVSLKPVYFLLALSLFAAFFVFFRMFVFYEAYLEAVIDKVRYSASIFRKGFISKKMSFPLDEIDSVGGGITIIAPENPDGVRVVEKIALQHGTVIPGFGEAKEFHTVHMELKGGRGIVLFSSTDRSEAKAVLADLKEFIGDEGAKED
jgi:hypothetical protein